MNDRIITCGKLIFDPPDFTNKHKKQSTWKKVAMVEIDGEICEYYGWFIFKRFNLKINPPLRKAHVTIINDKCDDFGESILLWDDVKNKWQNKEVEIHLSTSPRTNGKHWWLNIPEDERTLFHSIRNEVGLGRPFFGLHLSIGYVNDKYILHSEYIHNLIKLGIIT